MTYDISWSKKALKQLSKLDTETKKKIWRTIDKLRDENAQIKKLTSKDDEYRARAEDYRIVFLMEKKAIKIKSIGHRRDIYED